MEQRTIEELYTRFGFAVHRRCLRILGSKAEADDALQEVFLKVIRRGETLQSLGSVLAWLYTIADRVCIDRIRRRTKPSPEQSHPIADRREEAERIELVKSVLASCPERVSEVAVLYYVDGLTQDEVAAAVGYSRKTVKEKLSQFKKIARRLLGIEDDEVVV